MLTTKFLLLPNGISLSKSLLSNQVLWPYHIAVKSNQNSISTSFFFHFLSICGSFFINVKSCGAPFINLTHFLSDFWMLLTQFQKIKFEKKLLIVTENSEKMKRKYSSCCCNCKHALGIFEKINFDCELWPCLARTIVNFQKRINEIGKSKMQKSASLFLAWNACF